MKLRNYTPHAIDVQISGSWVKIPSEGIARVKQIDREVEYINGVKFYSIEFGDVEGLPEPAPDTRVIVSSIVKNAATYRTDLIVPTRYIRDEEGKILGCDGFGL